jgi:enterochelin esterase-like enzyme
MDHKQRKGTRGLIALLALFCLSLAAAPRAHQDGAPSGATDDLCIRAFRSRELAAAPVSGRIIVGFQPDLSKTVNPEDVLSVQPTFAWEVRDWQPGSPLLLKGDQALSWRGSLQELDGWFVVQAMLVTSGDFRPLSQTSFPEGGLIISDRSVVCIEKGRMCRPLDLLFRIQPKPPAIRESERLKALEMPSALLSSFHGHPVSVRGAVILPAEYAANPGSRYPLVLVLGGWGSSPFDGISYQVKRYGMDGVGKPKIFVFLDQEGPFGYHAFCSSQCNGPLEESLISELLPFLEKSYRLLPGAGSRFLVGQSTGGWAALWLQLRYPEQFRAAFAGSPDPVDFSTFLGCDLYAARANIFLTAGGQERCFSIKTDGGEPLSLRDFSGLDLIAGRGQQMGSFEAAFSPRAKDGQPRPLYDRESGAVDPEVAKAWKAHDLRLFVEKMNRSASRLLAGKVHLFVGERDEFGLNFPVLRFAQSLKQKGISADIRILPDTGHNVWSETLVRQIHERIDRLVAEPLLK